MGKELDAPGVRIPDELMDLHIESNGEVSAADPIGEILEVYFTPNGRKMDNDISESVVMFKLIDAPIEVIFIADDAFNFVRRSPGICEMFPDAFVVFRQAFWWFKVDDSMDF